MLFHRTTEASATRILAEGFADPDPLYDAFDNCGACVGIYLCTNRLAIAHRGGNPALLAIDLSDPVIAAAPNDACPVGDTDYVIRAAILNTFPLTRLE